MATAILRQYITQKRCPCRTCGQAHDVYSFSPKRPRSYPGVLWPVVRHVSDAFRRPGLWRELETSYDDRSGVTRRCVR